MFQKNQYYQNHEVQLVEDLFKRLSILELHGAI